MLWMAVAMCSILINVELAGIIMAVPIFIATLLAIYVLYLLFGVLLFYSALLNSSVWQFLTAAIAQFALYGVVSISIVLILSPHTAVDDLPIVFSKSGQVADTVYLIVSVVSHIIGVIITTFDLSDRLKKLQKTPPLIRKTLFLKVGIPRIIVSITMLSLFLCLLYGFSRLTSETRLTIGSIITTIIIVAIGVLIWLVNRD